MDLDASRLRLIKHLSTEIKDRRVLEIMARIPRELFLPSELRHLAYEDRPLPIGQGQTISQPFIVALMTQELTLKGDERVLEVGTGSGYQTAILAEMAKQVVTVERFHSLSEAARLRLDQLGYQNVQVYIAENILGWRYLAPYDAIIVTAGAPTVPNELVSQLALNGGRMVIPVGSQYEQELLKITRHEGTKIDKKRLSGVRFVPLVGEGAWEDE